MSRRASSSHLGRADVVPVLLALVGGAAYAAAHPPLGLWPLGWVALAPICLACTGRGAARSAIYGGLYGAVAAIGTSPWLPAMIGDYFGASPLVVWPLAALVWLATGAVYFVALGAWLGWATSRGAISPFVVGAVVWGLEWTRAHAAVANPWALLGTSQAGWLPAVQIADLVGVHGVSAVLVVASATLAGLVEPRLLGRTPRTSLVAACALVIAVLGYGYLSMATLPSEAAALRVGVVQGAIARDHRYSPEHRMANLEAHLALTQRAVDEGARLVVWPELALDFYVEREPELRRRLTAAVREAGVSVLAGGLGIAERDGVEGPANSVFLVTPEGIVDRSDKVRLMLFSESRPIPFLDIGSDRIIAGRRHELLHAADRSIGLAICSEAMLADHVRAVTRTGAELIVAPSNDEWFGTEGGTRQQLAAAAMRAVEMRRYVVRPTATGVSAVIDPVGRVLAETPFDEPAIAIVDVVPRDDLTPYARLGDVGLWAAVVLVTVDAVRRRTWRSAAVRSTAQPTCE